MQALRAWWQQWTRPRAMPPRFTWAWWGEQALVCTVFGITGSSSMLLARPVLAHVVGVQGSMRDGPAAYRVAYVLVMTPLYSAMLLTLGTLAGRHHYFKHVVMRMASLPQRLLALPMRLVSKAK